MTLKQEIDAFRDGLRKLYGHRRLLGMKPSALAVFDHQLELGRSWP
jgi:hypothetical protein